MIEDVLYFNIRAWAPEERRGSSKMCKGDVEKEWVFVRAWRKQAGRSEVCEVRTQEMLHDPARKT